jgi:hypothetical protein
MTVDRIVAGIAFGAREPAIQTSNPFEGSSPRLMPIDIRRRLCPKALRVLFPAPVDFRIAAHLRLNSIG